MISGNSFLNIWQYTMYVLIGLSILSGLFFTVYYWSKSASIKDYKKKYDFISRNEVKYQRRTIFSFALAVGFFINTLFVKVVQVEMVWILIRFFIGVCVATLIYYIFHLIFKYTYPAKLTRKLRRLRYKPRVSPDGNTMKLLSEDEEDVHLEAGKQAEEDVFSIDYDVWVDEKTGYVKIEKYPGHLEATKCGSCGFQTMKVVKEDIINRPTENTEGKLIKHYRCTYCKATRRKTFKIAKLIESDEQYELPEKKTYREDRQIDFVKLEIVSNLGEAKSMEFATIDDALEYLHDLKHDKKEPDEIFHS